MHHDQADFRILGETPDLIAVDKPAGLLVHPSKPGGPRTLWDGLRDLLAFEIANSGQVSLINRLDRETSGVVLVAKHSGAARTAAMAMQNGLIRKRYLALVQGHPAWNSLLVDEPIIRQGDVTSTKIHLKRIVHPAGAKASTSFRLLQCYESHAGPLALVEARPITGRTHQIRVHSSHIGHPILGDKIYGPSEDHYLEFISTGWTSSLASRLFLDRHALHSMSLSLVWGDSALSWEAPLPDDIRAFLC
jgi:23S rRNA pseudouridine1911/1915/1917 synthase